MRYPKGKRNYPPSSLAKRIRGHKGVALRKRRMARTNWLCEDCLAATPKRVRPASVVDHILPLAMGGLDIDSNTRNLCDECHEIRTAEQFGRDKKPRRDADGWPIW